MAGGIHSLKNTLENIKKYLEKTFTHEMAQQLCLDANKVAQLAKSIEDSGLPAALNTFFENINKAELVEKLGKSAEDVSALIEKLNNTEVIENFNTLLMRVHSYADLLGVEDFLKQYGHMLPYAAVGCTVLGALMPVALAYAGTRNGVDRKFQEFCQQRLDVIAATSMQTMKLNAGSFLLNYNSKKQKDAIGEQDHERLDKLAAQSRKLIDYTPDLDMAALNAFAVDLFKDLYVRAGVDPFNCVTQVLSDEMIDSACKGNLDAISFEDCGGLNYALVKKLHGKENVEAVMREVKDALRSNGGDALYYDLRYSAQSRDKQYSEKIRQIYAAFKENQNLDDLNQNAIITQLKNAAETVKAELGGDQDVDQAVIDVITNRALLGLCQETAGYFYFPWNLKEEVFAGVGDVASACTSVDELCASFEKTLSFSERPVRVTTQVATTAVAAAGAVAVTVVAAKRRMAK